MQNIKIGWRLMLITLSGILAVLALSTAVLMEQRAELIENRQIKTQHIIEAAHSIIAHYGNKEAAGNLGREEAQASAAADDLMDQSKLLKQEVGDFIRQIREA